jgi:flagellar biosynthesis protein FlhF
MNEEFPMIVRSFRGRTTAEALAVVRRELGERALIIDTRTISEPGLLGRKVGVEVVAAADPDTARNETELATVGATARSNTVRSGGNRWGAQAAGLATPPADDTPPAEGLSVELAAIRRQLARLASGQAVPAGHLGEDLAAELEAGELPAELLAECDEAVQRAGERLDPTLRRDFLARLLGRHLRCPGALDWANTRSLLMVGPTGVGKTTTIAKLAGHLVLERRRRVALITIDTYRVGAADQLQAYADLLEMPFAIARTPAELGQAAERFADCDNLLIDTAGRSPADAARLHELRGFCRALPGMQVMLAIAATAGRAEFARIVERFSVLPLEHTVVTKLDELAAPGRLYGCLRRHALPLTYVTTGQEVPADFRPASAQEFAALAVRAAA